MREIPPQNGDPRILIFDSKSELEEKTGQSHCHGYYCKKQNLIVATTDSLAHEIAHFKDFSSGSLKDPSQMDGSIGRIEACLRNEMVAIIYAFKKCGFGGASLPYEFEFLKWLQRFLEADRSRRTPPEEMSFKEIQELANELSSSHHPAFERIKFFFSPYLDSEFAGMTYGDAPVLKQNLGKS